MLNIFENRFKFSVKIVTQKSTFFHWGLTKIETFELIEDIRVYAFQKGIGKNNIYKKKHPEAFCKNLDTRSPVHVFSCEFCKTIQNNNSVENLHSDTSIVLFMYPYQANVIRF